MTKDNIYSQLTEIFEETIGKKGICLNEATTANDIDGWDSFTHILLISSIEQRFNVKFSMNEIVEFHNVGSMVELILSKLASQERKI